MIYPVIRNSTTEDAEDTEEVANDERQAFYTGTGTLSTISWIACSACSDFFRVEE